MRTYEGVVSELEAKNIFPNGSVFFQYVNSKHPLEKGFQELFRFGQDFLDRTDLNFATDKARFFFSDRDASCAYATNANGYYLIDFYRGVIEKLNLTYETKSVVFSNPRFDFLKAIISRLGLKPKDFFIQFTSMLYFYHEATHFVQRYNEHEKKLPFSDEQRQRINIPITLLREFDADWYGAAHTVTNVHERTENESEFIELSTMALAAFFLFWVERSDLDYTTIFSMDRMHPHPLIRLCTWIMSLLLTAKDVFGYTIDARAILDDALRVAALLEGEKGNAKSLQVQNMIESKYQEILDYILEIDENSKHYPYLANNTR